MQEIKIESTFTIKDYRKVAYYNTYGRSLVLTIGNLLLFAMGIINLATGMMSGALGIIITIICFVYPFFSFGQATMRINQRIVKNKVPNESKQRLFFTENGVHFQREDLSQQYDWGQVNNVNETNNYLLFYMEDRRVLTLPKRDIQQDHLYHLRALITSKLSFKKYRLKK